MAFWKKPEDERDPLGDKLVKPKTTGSSTREYWMSGDRPQGQGRTPFIATPAQPRRPDPAPSAPVVSDVDVLDAAPIAPPEAFPEAPELPDVPPLGGSYDEPALATPEYSPLPEVPILPDAVEPVATAPDLEPPGMPVYEAVDEQPEPVEAPPTYADASPERPAADLAASMAHLEEQFPEAPDFAEPPEIEFAEPGLEAPVELAPEPHVEPEPTLAEMDAPDLPAPMEAAEYAHAPPLPPIEEPVDAEEIEPPLETVIETRPVSSPVPTPTSSGALALKSDPIHEPDEAPEADAIEASPDHDDASTDTTTEADDDSDIDNIIDFRARHGVKGAMASTVAAAATAAMSPPARKDPEPVAPTPEKAVASADDVTEEVRESIKAVMQTPVEPERATASAERPMVAPRVVIGDADDDLSDQFDSGDTDYDYVSDEDDGDDWSRKGEDDYVYADSSDVDAQDQSGGAYYSTAAGTPIPTRTAAGQSGGRRSALYLAGAASITAICAAVYYLLPHDGPEPVDTRVADRTPTDGKTVVGVASLDKGGQAATATSQTTTGLDDRTVVDDLKVAPETVDTEVVSVPAGELFAETTTSDPATTTSTATRELTPPADTLSSPDKPVTDSVVEAPPKVKVAVETPKTEPVAKPVQTASITPPKPAPEVRAPAVSKPTISVQSTTTPVTTAKAAPRSVATTTLRAPMPSFTGDIRADSVANLLWSQYGGGSMYATSDAKRAFALQVQRAFETTPVGQSAGIGLSDGQTVTLTFNGDTLGQRPLEINRAADIAPIGDGFSVESGWFVTSSRANLRKAPDLQSGDVRTILPQNALVQRMGVVTTASGDRWYVIGQDGVAVGYLHASVATPYAVAPRVPAGQWRLAIPAQATDYVSGASPCRSFSASGGSGYLSGTGCLAGGGQWLTSAPAVASARTSSTSARVYSASSGSGLTAAPSTTQVVRSASATSSSIQTSRLASIPQDIAEILFNPVASRRASRHGEQVSNAQIDSIFTRTQSIAVTGTDGPSGRLTVQGASQGSHVQVVERTADLPTLPDRMTLDTRFARTMGELRLMTQPDGRVTDTPVQPVGSVLQVLGEVETGYGESWSLVGRDGVGYGFVRTRALSQIYGAGNVTSLPSATSVSDSVTTSAQCRQASYAAGQASREITACLSADGHWQVVDYGRPAYKMQTVASIG